MIDPKDLVRIDRSETWMESFMSYLHDETLPHDSKEANRINKKLEWFLL